MARRYCIDIGEPPAELAGGAVYFHWPAQLTGACGMRCSPSDARLHPPAMAHAISEAAILEAIDSLGVTAIAPTRAVRAAGRRTRSSLPAATLHRHPLSAG